MGSANKEDAVKAAFLKTDKDFLNLVIANAAIFSPYIAIFLSNLNYCFIKIKIPIILQGLGSGVCCVTALIQGEEVIISNLGDCRAVLSRGGVAEAVTKDHRVEQEDERKRIENKVLSFNCYIVRKSKVVQ